MSKRCFKLGLGGGGESSFGCSNSAKVVERFENWLPDIFSLEITFNQSNPYHLIEHVKADSFTKNNHEANMHSRREIKSHKYRSLQFALCKARLPRFPQVNTSNCRTKIHADTHFLVNDCTAMSVR